LTGSTGSIFPPEQDAGKTTSAKIVKSMAEYRSTGYYRIDDVMLENRSVGHHRNRLKKCIEPTSAIEARQ
jgi:hypothetical protein